MELGKPSRTALRVALRRAAHQSCDSPLVLDDPFAVRLLQSRYAAELARTPSARGLERPFSVSLRAWMVVRSRFAEDVLRAGVAEGVLQYLVLGAGLDTLALRNPFSQLTVFEVDHPATQQWKLDLMAENRIAVPECGRFVGVDFEHGSLEGELLRAGFDLQQPTAVSWLGVVPYLTHPAFRATLKFLQTIASCSVVMDYARPPDLLPPLERLGHESLAMRVALAGEPFRMYLDVEEMATELAAAGIGVVEDLGGKELNARYLDGRTDGLKLRGSAGRVVHAVKRE